jgi:hypothetical protein
VDLLELLPLLTPERLAAAPEPLLRTLFERFQLQVCYHKPQNRATIRVALSDDSLDGLLASLGDIDGGAAQRDRLGGRSGPSGQLVEARAVRDGSSARDLGVGIEERPHWEAQRPMVRWQA